jgi:hypothetical protein
MRVFLTYGAANREKRLDKGMASVRPVWRKVPGRGDLRIAALSYLAVRPGQAGLAKGELGLG